MLKISKGKYMAGGSQIIINKNGIKIITPAKFEAKAGQHLFNKGSKIQTILPNLSNLVMNKESYSFTNRIDVFDIFQDYDFSQVKYRAFLPEQETYKVGNLDENGRTERFVSLNNAKEKIQVVIDDPAYEWSITDESDIESNINKED